MPACAGRGVQLRRRLRPLQSAQRAVAQVALELLVILLELLDLREDGLGCGEK